VRRVHVDGLNDGGYQLLASGRGDETTSVPGSFARSLTPAEPVRSGAQAARNRASTAVSASSNGLIPALLIMLVMLPRWSASTHAAR